MTPLFGWVGKILRVDLTTGAVSEESTYKYAPKFIGGRAMAARVYWEEVGPEVGAYDPGNKLIIMTGPTTGTLGPGVGRFAIVSKSPDPFPNCYFYSAPSGHFGPELKFAGYDGLIVQGKAEKPVYLWINDGEVDFNSPFRLSPRRQSDSWSSRESLPASSVRGSSSYLRRWTGTLHRSPSPRRTDTATGNGGLSLQRASPGNRARRCVPAGCQGAIPGPGRFCTRVPRPPRNGVCHRMLRPFSLSTGSRSPSTPCWSRTPTSRQCR
ncbi:MAG: hypothetical protein HYX92_16740 [Chloroflexi bacterium]|nr:hypothetical protein [Chloroflexota bacterium]